MRMWLCLALGCQCQAQDSSVPSPAPTGDTGASSSATTGHTGDMRHTGHTGADPVTPLSDDGKLSFVWVSLSGEEPLAYVIGQLYDIVAPGASAVIFAQPNGVDQCALTLYQLVDLGLGTANTLVHQSAGTLTVENPSTGDLVYVFRAQNVYYRDILPATDMPLDGSYIVTAPGDVFPGFTGEVKLPRERLLAEPAHGFTTPGGDLQLVWTGGDPGQIRLQVDAQDSEPTATQSRGHLECQIANDGAFTVPGALIDQLPDGRLSIHMAQVDTTWVETAGRWVLLEGLVVNIAVGVKL